jgi:hypothetical protein
MQNVGREPVGRDAPPGNIRRRYGVKLGFVAVLHLPLPALGLGPLGEQGAGPVVGDALAAEVVNDDITRELARQHPDGITWRLHILVAIAEPSLATRPA